MSEAQGGGLNREKFPPNTTPARAREPAPLRWKQNYSVVDLLLNYVCLIFRRGKKNQVLAPASHAHTVKLSTLTMQPVHLSL